MFNIHPPFGGLNTFQTAVGKPGNSDQTLSANFTIVNKYSPSLIDRTGSIVRLQFEPPASGTTTITAAYIGFSAISGSAWNFNGSPTQLTFAGSSGTTLTAGGGFVYSDELAFDVTDTVSISVAMNVSSGSVVRRATGISSLYVSYTKSGVSEAASATKGTGYTALSGTNYIIRLFEVA